MPDLGPTSLIMALDLSTNLGFAIGRANERPRVASRVLLGDPAESDALYGSRHALRNGQFYRWLRMEFAFKPDLVVIESAMKPVAMKSQDAIESQQRLHGIAESFALGWRDVALKAVHPDVVRAEFCGQRRSGDGRQSTKNMVINFAIARGYVPADCRDDNAADAAALFHYAKHTWCNVPRSHVVLGGRLVPTIGAAA